MEKKIIISDGIEKKEDIKIKKGKKDEKKIDDGIKNLYQQPFDHSEKTRFNQGKFVFWTIILVLIIGFLAGSSGSLFILSRKSIDVPFVGKIDLTKFFPKKTVNLVTEKKVTVTQDLRLASLNQDLKTKIVYVYLKKAIPEQGKMPFLEQIYAPWQIKSLAIIITNNGWLASSIDFDTTQEYVVIDKDNNVFPVQKIIKDTTTGINFLKINIVGQQSAQSSLIKFANQDEITAGQQIVIINKFGNLYLTSITSRNFRNITKTEDLVRSTDKFSENLMIKDNSLISHSPGGAMFDFSGSLIGLLSANQKIIPFWQFNGLVKDDLEKGKITHPYLGIDYLRINEAPGLQSALFQNLKQGAIVYGNPTPGSPASQAGIKNADVIVKVDGLSLSPQYNLTNLVQKKLSGDTIELDIIRKGEEKTFNIPVAFK